ncbi:MAG: AAA family ATPase [Muribaculum sp.]|nr:AAA family ATPase [Muribaculum sp.]
MRLVRCHIDNFGKFSDYEVDFTGNPCVFREPNGWGKSTLAAFIKVMFYGFANEKKRGDALERERMRYKPWQGGSYGGELEFEAGGKRYLLNRTFGSKESADTFLLYDAATNLPSNDFSANIGEELFQINQESFLRTVYIAQNDCYTAATDSINAKIGNLSECLDDMSNYEKAQQAVKDLWNSLNPARKSGSRSLKRQKEEIAQLREELRRTDAVEQAVSELEEKLGACLARREERMDGRKAAQAAWEAAAAAQAVEARRTHYESILQQYEEKARSAEETLAALGGKAPERETLRRMQDVRGQMIRRESEADACALEEAERERLSWLRTRFREGIPPQGTLRRGEALLERLETLRTQAAEHRLSGGELLEYQTLQARFLSQKDCTEAQAAELLRRLDGGVAELNLYIEKESGLATKKAALGSMRMLERSVEDSRGRERRDKRFRPSAISTILAGLAFVCLIAGGVLLGTGRYAAGVAPLSAGVVLTAAAVWSVVRRGGTSGRSGSEDALYSGGEASEGTAALEREIAQDESRMQEAERYAADCLNAFGMDLSDFGGDVRQARDALYGLRHDWQRLGCLRARESDYLQKGYEDKMRDAREEIGEILRPYCAQDESRLRDERLAELYEELCRDVRQFAELADRAGKWERAREEAAALRTQLETFLREYGQGGEADPDAALRAISQKTAEYEKDLQEWDRLKTERQEFEASCDVGLLQVSAPPAGETQEALQARMEALDEETQDLWEQARAYREQLDERQQELEELADMRERLEELEAVYAADYAYYTNLGITGEYLKRAKESLSAKYIGPMYASFRRGYELIAGESGEDFRMDADIRVSRRAMGEMRETKAFSLGSQDLIYIVLRVALADAMYEGERPFLILDDSFVNLDEKRMESAWTFLQDTARRYQVIYFTCHGSRAGLENRSGLERQSV